MVALLHHRGPDSSGVHDEQRICIGNTRLNVLDPRPEADLPMSSPDGGIWIAYNGEVTNFKELRRDFNLDSTYNFRTTGDTEVLLALYERMGIDFVRELTGMFAFCLFDGRKQKAWIVRDFFGIRPLFFMRKGDHLWFGSEIKAFLDLPGFSGEIDTEGIWDFFTLAYIPGDHTPFRDVEELQGSEWLAVDLVSGDVRRETYYELDYNPDSGIKEKDAAEELYHRMRDSVRRNLISDAPLGLTLSGGFDTSSILAFTRDLAGDREIHTYSVRMGDKSFDESGYQRLMAEHCGTRHHEIYVGPREVADSIVDHMAFMDEPSGDGAAVPSYLLAAEATRDMTVLLSGEGGDETFNAYETHLACKARRLYRIGVPKPLRWMVRSIAHGLPVRHSKLSIDFLAKRFTQGAELGVVESHLFWRYVLTGADKKRIMPDLAGLRPTWTVFQDMYDNLDYEDPLDRISVLDIRNYFIADLMVKNDRTFMAHSIEARFPYMDRLLLDYVSKIPAGLRIKGFRRRHIQKKAARGIVPAEIHRRGNFGLEMPNSAWLVKELRDLAEAYFTPENISRLGFLDPDGVLELWREHLNRRVDHGRALWCMLNLLIWYDLFVYSKSFRQYLKQPRSTDE